MQIDNMNIVEVKQNWKSDVVRIDLTISNICNYKCWYCFEGSNTGTYKWPDFDLYVKNLSHLMDHYLRTTNKKKFDFHVLGGEATYWNRFFEFIAYFKQRYDCLFTLTTNGTRKLDWWGEAYKYLDYVSISSHHQYTKPDHVIEVADFLYKKNVIVNVLVLMDPLVWDKCIDTIAYYKKSKYSWSIRYLEIIGQPSVVYTDEQKKVLNKLRARRANLFWFLKNNKSFRSNVKVIDDDNKSHSVGDHEIIMQRMNNFKGWSCNLGVDWIAIKMDGTVSGICGNGLFSDHLKYNLTDPEFVTQFNPVIEPTVCQTSACWCLFEANMPKRKITSTSKNKVIPIHAN